MVGFIEGDVPALSAARMGVERGGARRGRRGGCASTTTPRRLPARRPPLAAARRTSRPRSSATTTSRPTTSSSTAAELVGAIDFDTASPGPRIWDLAYLAYRLVPLTAPGNPDAVRADEDRAARLERLCAAYGGDGPDAVIATAARRVDELAAFTAARADAGEGDGTPCARMSPSTGRTSRTCVPARRRGDRSPEPGRTTHWDRRSDPARTAGATRGTAGARARVRRPVRYPSDDLTPAERDRLAPHVTDLDGPVFALVNLPETVKGALFARYSRYPGTLRRLFLEEFADSVPEGRRVRR